MSVTALAKPMAPYAVNRAFYVAEFARIRSVQSEFLRIQLRSERKRVNGVEWHPAHSGRSQSNDASGGYTFDWSVLAGLTAVDRRFRAYTMAGPIKMLAAIIQ